MRRILTFALLAAFALAAAVPVSIVTAGKAEANGGLSVHVFKSAPPTSKTVRGAAAHHAAHGRR